MGTGSPIFYILRSWNGKILRSKGDVLAQKDILGKEEAVFLLTEEQEEWSLGELRMAEEFGLLARWGGEREEVEHPCWKVLGLRATATVEAIKARFRELALKHHPDVGGEEGAFVKVREAYEEALRMKEGRGEDE